MIFLFSFGSCHGSSRGNSFTIKLGNLTESSKENEPIRLFLDGFQVSGNIDSSCIPIITLQFIDLNTSPKSKSLLWKLYQEQGENFWVYFWIFICSILVLILIFTLIYAKNHSV